MYSILLMAAAGLACALIGSLASGSRTKNGTKVLCSFIWFAGGAAIMLGILLLRTADLSVFSGSVPASVLLPDFVPRWIASGSACLAVIIAAPFLPRIRNTFWRTVAWILVIALMAFVFVDSTVLPFAKLAGGGYSNLI